MLPKWTPVPGQGSHKELSDLAAIGSQKDSMIKTLENRVEELISEADHTKDEGCFLEPWRGKPKKWRLLEKHLHAEPKNWSPLWIPQKEKSGTSDSIPSTQVSKALVWVALLLRCSSCKQASVLFLEIGDSLLLLDFSLSLTPP